MNTLKTNLIYAGAAALPAAPQVQDDKVKVATNLVLIDVLVTDPAGRSVKGLSAEQFRLLSDDKQQPLDIFFSDGAPVAFGFVYDMHPTTAERTKMVVDSLQEFKKGIRPNDSIFTLAFNMNGSQVFDFIPTTEQLERYLTEPDAADPHSLYDAVYSASNKIFGIRKQKRALIIISDGADHQSARSFAQLEDKLSTIKAEVYAVLLDNNNFIYRDMNRNGRETYPVASDATPLDRAALLQLTLESGGTTYFGGPASSVQLNGLYRDISNEMRSYYTLGFYTDVVDTSRHSIRIQLKDRKDSQAFVLTYRNSYQNPRPNN